MVVDSSRSSEGWNIPIPSRNLEEVAEGFVHDKDEGVNRISIRGLPTIITDMVHHKLKKRLPGGRWRRTTANVYRILIRTWLPEMEQLANRSQHWSELMERAVDEGTDMERRKIAGLNFKYDIDEMLLGDVGKSPVSVYCASRSEQSKIISIAEDLGLDQQVVAAVILVGALSMSTDPECVSPRWKKEFQRIVKDFSSLFTMPREDRAEVLQQLREIYDGHYKDDRARI